jgi:hypothetical protein
VADGHESVLTIHNRLVNEAITVRPVLVSATGDRTIELDEISLGPLGNALVDIGDAMDQRYGPGLYYGSAVLEWKEDWSTPVLAEIVVRRRK